MCTPPGSEPLGLRSARTCLVLLFVAPSGPSRQPHTRRSIAACGTRWVLTAYSPPRWGALAAAAVVANARTRRRVVGPKATRACTWERVYVRKGLSGNECKWEPKPERAAEWSGRKCRCSHARTHVRSRTERPTRCGSRSAVIGKSAFVGGLAAGLGGAFVCLLVVGIVVFLRRRRSARAADPASDVRTLLYVDESSR